MNSSRVKTVVSDTSSGEASQHLSYSLILGIWLDSYAQIRLNTMNTLEFTMNLFFQVVRYLF